MILRSCTTCKFSDTKCIDIEAGNAFWYPIPQTCENNKYVELYSGYVDKLEDEGRQTIFALKTGDVTSAFSAVGTIPACSAVLIRTEHPKLFFLEGPTNEYFETSKNPAVQNLDIFAYVNSKFVYVEKHVRKELKSLYYDVITQKCELEKK